MRNLRRNLSSDQFRLLLENLKADTSGSKKVLEERFITLIGLDPQQQKKEVVEYYNRNKDDLTVSDLKELLNKLNAKTSGKKRELEERLLSLISIEIKKK